jgi:hypothetical protein
MLERNDRTEGYPKQDAIVGCSWSLVALASGSPDVNAFDVNDHDRRCVRDRSATERAVIRQQAERLFQQFYGKPLPSALLDRR